MLGYSGSYSKRLDLPEFAGHTVEPLRQENMKRVVLACVED
jgi:hypothetical protein